MSSDVKPPVSIAIDRERCIGSGNCAFWVPEVFALDDSDVAIVLDPTAAPLEQVIEMARRCPTGAITVTADRTH